MNDITPDVIAAIASRLYNELSGVNHVPKSETAVQDLPVQAPGLPAALPAAFPAAENPAAQAVPQAPPAATPAAFRSIEASHTLSPHVAGGPADGLRAFIQRVRLTGIRSDSGGCVPGLEGGLAPRSAQLKSLPEDTSPVFHVPTIRRDFPILNQQVHGKPLVWFDNAATTQKPQSVIDAVANFYAHDNSNIHRGAHTLAARATDAYEQARQKVQAFLGASSAKEILFVRGTTEGINLVSQTYGRKFLQAGDEIVLTTLEHHANIVPWQMIAKEKGAVLRVVPITDRGEVMLEEYQSLLGPRTRLVALAQASNGLGTVLPVAEMTQMAKRYNARVLIDGAQSVAHIPVNVQQLGCDFFVFSGHKIFAPTGIGVVYAKEELLEIHAALARRRQHDPQRDVRRDDLRGTAGEVRGRHAEHCRRGGTGRGAGLCQSPRAAEHRAARAGTAALRHGGTAPHPRSADHRHGAGEGRADLVRPQGPARPRKWAGSWTRRG